MSVYGDFLHKWEGKCGCATFTEKEAALYRKVYPEQCREGKQEGNNMTRECINMEENREDQTMIERYKRLPYRIRLRSESVPLYAGAGTEYVRLGSLTDDFYDLEIAEERMGKEQKLWGRLRSDAGWILLEHTEKITI